MRLRENQGFTLIEVMVSASILAVGVLGMAAMQGVAMTKNVDANEMSVVTNITSDMMERIQNNRRWAWAYNNLQAQAPAGNCGLGGVPALPPPAPFYTMAITPTVTQTVRGDCTQWTAMVLASNFLNVQGLVLVAPSSAASVNSMTVTVALNWNDRKTQRPRRVAVQSVIVPE
jgi:type IV pilus assembly protein PilV